MRTRRATGLDGPPTLPLLSETLLVGVVVALATLPLVTALPALTAGARHLRRHLDGRDDSTLGLLRDTGRTVRRLWVPGAALPAALLLLGFNAWFVTANDVPGGLVVAALAAALAAVVTVVVLRFAAAWSEDGGPWQQQVRDAAGRAHRDLAGSALLLAATGATGALVWMLTPLFVLVGGLLALAALSVETRWERLQASPDERTL